MTRTDQIQKAAMEYASNQTQDKGNAYLDFVRTAEWADRTMIERVCNWLEQNMYIENVFEYDFDEYPAKYVCASACDSVDELVNNFRKAMEE